MFTLNCKGRLVVIDEPVIMGIVNITPDSFYAGSRVADPESVIVRVGQMISEGATIIDIGAQSTRPQSALLTAGEELARLGDLFRILHQRYPDTIFSVDTFYSETARYCVSAGASMINDVSGGSMDRDMIPVAGNLRVPYVCMHMKGTPQTMTEHAQYDDIATEVLDYFIERTDACRLAGIHDIVIDPGFGFSKTITQNFELLRRMQVLGILGRPVLAGLSRKSTIYNTLDVTAAGALNGSTVLHTIALLNGASILRVHDVREAREAVQLVSAYRRAAAVKP